MPGFRDSILEAVKNQETLPEVDLPELEDDNEPQQQAEPEQDSQVSSDPTQPESQPKTEAPSLPAATAPAVDDSWRKDIETKLETSNGQMQMLLTRLVDKLTPQQKQEEAQTGSVNNGDPYFATEQYTEQLVNNRLKPVLDTMETYKQQLHGLHEDRVSQDFYKAEAEARTKFGESFDKYVSPELRSKALQNARIQAKNGQLNAVDWATLFEQEYQTKHYPDLARADQERRDKEALQAKQQEELKKVSAMPKGTTSHQAPVAPKRNPADRESRMDSFRSSVKSAWKRFTE